MEKFLNEWMVFLISAVPVLEQKAAIPYGVAAKLAYWQIYFYSLAGAILPAPLILLTIEKIFRWLKRFKKIKPLIEWIERRTIKKGKNIVQYELIGLFLFVAIPLPGTGVWTGSLAASLLHLKFKDALIAICLGAAVCGVIILFLSHGVGSIM